MNTKRATKPKYRDKTIPKEDTKLGSMTKEGKRYIESLKG